MFDVLVVRLLFDEYRLREVSSCSELVKNAGNTLSKKSRSRCLLRDRALFVARSALQFLFN
jgi:hypothetical protein